MDRVVINPPAVLLGSVNAIVGGRARRYEAANIAGPLSIKCVVDGVAAWETASGRFEIGPAGWLVLNDGEEYTITVDSLRPVEFGQTPHRYVTRLRLERAAALLRGSDREVVAVANACGFSSAGSFTTLFTKTFGAAPSRFRKNGETAAGAARYHRRP